MTWLQTLLIAAVPSGVTVVGLIWQLRMTNAATAQQRQEEVAERERDRQAEQAAREAERRHALDDHWRSERARSHSEFIASLGQALMQVTTYLENVRVNGEGEIVEGDHTKGMSREFEDALRRIMADVNIYGGEESRVAGVHCWDAIFAIQSQVMWALLIGVPPLPNRAELRVKLSHAASMRGDYINAVRRELGTAH